MIIFLSNTVFYMQAVIIVALAVMCETL